METKRRWRWTDDGTKSVTVTQRDIEIFKLLARYRFLRADYIHAFVSGNQRWLSERLSLLSHKPNKYLSFPLEQMNYYNANYRYKIYELAHRGEAVLAARGIFPDDYRPGDRKHFSHAMMMNDALASLELGIRKQGIRHITWPEIQQHPKFNNPDNPRALKVYVTHTIKGKRHAATFNYINDGIFGADYGDGVRFFQIEAEHSNRVDCGNLQQTSFLKKYLAIKAVMQGQFYKKFWGMPNLITLVVVPHRERLETMKRLIERIDPQGCSYIAFKELPVMEDYWRKQRPMPELWLEPWKRVGHPPLDLTQPYEKEPINGYRSTGEVDRHAQETGRGDGGYRHRPSPCIEGESTPEML